MNNLSQVLAGVLIFGLLTNCNNIVEKSYTIEAINDTLIFEYPNPEPVHVVTKSFTASKTVQEESISIASKNLHNISVTIENTGFGVIKDPYIFNSEEYDYRSLPAFVSKIVEGETTSYRKFMRVSEWFTYHYDKFGLYPSDNYEWDDYAGNAPRLINQYGGSLCGEAAQCACALLYHVPPKGSMYGHKVQLDGHQTAEVWYDGSWHQFDNSPEIRWVYFEEDNKTIVPTWADLKKDGGNLIKRIKPLTGWDIWWAVKNAPTNNYGIVKEVGTQWKFRYDLKPAEKITMLFDMNGRTDLKSRDYSHHRKYLEDEGKDFRNPCDYASAIFTYKPDFTIALHKQFILKENNIKWTNKGIVPADNSKLASIIIPVKSTWDFVGANIKASFLSSGNIYFAVTDSIGDTAYSDNLKWNLLKENTVFEDDSIGIEGRMAYWLKFEFRGKGSGLKSAVISSEVQMSKYTMPGLKFGENNIKFTAADMNNSSVKVTYKYDNQSKYDYYEPATENYGRHIYYRVGGNHIKHWTKPLFYRNIKNNPNGTLPIKVEIYKVTGNDFGKRVRLLKDEEMALGTYYWYWDGRDDAGNKLPPGMYAYKVTGEVGEGRYHESDEFGERMFLFDKIWPIPNEIRTR